MRSRLRTLSSQAPPPPRPPIPPPSRYNDADPVQSITASYWRPAIEPRRVAERGYAHPELLVETDWLADHLTDRNVRVIDARRPKDYGIGHIPGAVNVSGFGGIPRAENGDMAEPDEFARLAGALGISNDRTVIVYDAPSQMMGNRCMGVPLLRPPGCAHAGWRAGEMVA